MFRHRLPLLAAALLAPHIARSAGALEGFYGIERPPSADFSSAVSGVSAPDLFKTSLQMYGGDVLFNLGGLELAAILDTTFGDHTASQTAIGALGGLSFGTGLTLDLLAEAGGHRYGDFVSNPQIITASSTNEWLFYVGLRPGVRFKVAGPMFAGLWGFARWDVSSQKVPVTVGSAASAGSYKLGGTTIGATLRLGLEL